MAWPIDTLHERLDPIYERIYIENTLEFFFFSFRRIYLAWTWPQQRAGLVYGEILGRV